MERDELNALADRVECARCDQRLSYRELGKITGVPFSTLARVARGSGSYSRETERKMRLWLGEPVSHIMPAEMTRQAEDIGRAAARAFSAEIQSIVTAAALRALARETPGD